MATRNPANEIEFGAVNFGASIAVFAVAGATGADAQVAPGQAMEAFVEAVQLRGTTIGLGSFDSGAFNVYVEGSSWSAAALEAAVQAIGGVFASATVTDSGL